MKFLTGFCHLTLELENKLDERRNDKKLFLGHTKRS